MHCRLEYISEIIISKKADLCAVSGMNDTSFWIYIRRYSDGKPIDEISLDFSEARLPFLGSQKTIRELRVEGISWPQIDALVQENLHLAKCNYSGYSP